MMSNSIEEIPESSSRAEEKTSNPNSRSKEGDAEPESEKIAGDVNDISKNKSIPHQFNLLEHSWTFWFDNPSSRSNRAPWGSSRQPTDTVSTGDEFWSLYENIPCPSKLDVGANFFCFKHKIEPKWEDPVCANGGKWNIIVPREKLDTYWLNTLRAMVEEQFDHGDEICGAAVSVRRKQNRIALWTKNAANETAQISIGKQWMEFIDYHDTIGFMTHEDAKKQGRSARNRYAILSESEKHNLQLPGKKEKRKKKKNADLL